MVSPALVVRWLPVTAQKIVPWRNGSGSTREVAIEPPSASVATGFVWRVSIAGVAADGPFSSFPGIDRSLWLLRGAGMELTIDGDSTRLVRPLQRIDFAGEASVQARLLGGPTEDLNVMVARSAAVGSAAVCELAVGEVLAVELTAAQHLLLVLSGAIALAGGTAGPGDAVRLDGAGPLRATASAACTLLRASFTLRQPAVDGR